MVNAGSVGSVGQLLPTWHVCGEVIQNVTPFSGA
jgi:hypothetical protein